MYPSLISGSFTYIAPWGRETLSARLNELESDLPKVAWVYEKPDTSTFRYRVYNMVEGLRSEKPQRVAASWFSGAEIPNLINKISEVDTLVLSRMRYDAEVAQLISAARSRGIPVLFDCDDLVFDTRYVHLLASTLDLDTSQSFIWDFWFAYCSRLEATARLCDGGISTNEFLAARMREVVNGPVHIVPNFLNRQQQAISNTLLAAKSARGFAGQGSVGIGYFSGSPTHNRDFAVAAPALARLMDSDPDVRVRVVGYLDPVGPLAAYGDRVEMVPMQDWFNLQLRIAEMEINIAPLQDNCFTNCKSELKFFEAAAVGTWTLATPTGSFRNAIESPSMGFLPRAEDWDQALSQSVALVRSHQEYAKLAESTADAVHRKYGWDRFCDQIQKATLINA